MESTRRKSWGIGSKSKGIVAEIKIISDAAKQGRYDVRGNEEHFRGKNKEIIKAVNAGFDALMNKITWYESIIDSVPFEIHVTDNNMKWTYMNKAFEKLMVGRKVIKDRKSAYGMDCSNAGASICNTENCGIKQLLKGNPQSFFDWGEKHCKQDTSRLKNIKGENIGFVEVVTDLTPMVSVANYTDTEVERVEKNLGLLANGNLEFDLQVKESNEYTVEIKDQFQRINNSLKLVKNAVSRVINDTNMLAEASIEGKLDVRADDSKHGGGFKNIIVGFNNTLNSISAPINEARQVMKKLSVNDYTTGMIGTYKGNMKEFAEETNLVHTSFVTIQTVFSLIAVGDTSYNDHFIKTGKLSENDKLFPLMTATLTAIERLINESKLLAEAGINGDLKLRSDVSKFEGGYREILFGFNSTLDAIEKPINEASEVLEKMAAGNLTTSIDGDYLGSYAIIKDSINNTITSFNEILGNINTSADQVNTGSKQVSYGSQALSQGSTEQASSMEELTATITEVAAKTRENALNANQANELALVAEKNAEHGNIQMKEMLKSMGEINDSSSSISKIIKVIDDIAFQTNILALNAAIEAARAGQAGKGFAVVAEEVRSLSAKSAEAAKQTSELIEDSIKKVESGTKIANGTAESLNEIVDGVAKAATLLGGIATASNEQATAISEINKGIEQVSQVIQTNSATAEESAAASEELSSQAELLKNMIGNFELKSVNSNSDRNESRKINKMQLNAKNIIKSLPGEKANNSKSRISLSDNEFGKY